MCVLTPQKYIFKIVVTHTSSYCDGIFDNDMHSHILPHAHLNRIYWIILNNYWFIYYMKALNDAMKDYNDAIHYFLHCSIVTYTQCTKLCCFVKLSCPYDCLCNNLHICERCCIESQHGNTCSCCSTQLYIHSTNRRKRRRGFHSNSILH